MFVCTHCYIGVYNVFRAPLVMSVLLYSEKQLSWMCHQNVMNESFTFEIYGVVHTSSKVINVAFDSLLWFPV